MADKQETRPPDINRFIDGFWGYQPLFDEVKQKVENAFNANGQNPIRVKVWIDREAG